MKTNIIFLAMLLISSFSIAQQIEVTGLVTEQADGLPLPGVNVLVKGTTRGTNTDFNGRYTINVSANEQLEFSYVGYKTQTVTITNQTTIDVALEEDTQSLDEVVVIGYGTAQKRDLTGSIAKVDGDVVADKPEANPVASLQGRVAGLSVVNNGRIGQQPDVRIRGTSSRFNTQPLYVVDGIFADNIDFINPNDIESIEILKDASSLAIFGVRGANGVIIVTTKKAKQGRLTVNFNSNFGVKTVVNEPEMADAALFRELFDERLENEGAAPFGFYDVFTGNTDWVREITNSSAYVYTTNLSVQSASERNSISMGLGYREETGLILEERLQRITFNLNDELRLSDNFKVGATVNAVRDRLPNQGNFTSALNATPIVSPIRFDERPEFNGVYNQLPQEIGGPQIANPLLVAEVTKNKRIAEQYRFVGNIFAELTFLKDFTFRVNYFGDYLNRTERRYTPIVDTYISETDEVVSLNLSGNDLTRVNQNTFNTLNFQQEYLLSYKKQFGDHNVNATIGYTTYQTEYEELTSEVQNDPAVGQIPDDPRFWYVGVLPYGDPTTRISNSNQFKRATTSLLARVIYNYQSKYLVNASYRRDATSQLAPDNRAQDFWSLGLAWVPTKEKFLENFEELNLLKIKGSVGELGNQVVELNYPFYPGVDANATAIFGNNVIPGFNNRFEENPNLQWETIFSWEAGFESEWLDRKLSFNALYYTRRTDNLLVFNTALTPNFFDNEGEIENKGFEFEASWSDNIGDNFSYSVGGNLTTINNEVLSTRADAAIFAGNGQLARTITGEPIGHFFGYVVEGVYQTNADIAASPVSELAQVAPGDLKFADINDDGVINPDDRTIIGNPTPDFTYGFFTNFNYKRFYLNADFQGVYGNEVYRDWGNGSSFAQFNYRAARAGRWTGQGTSNFEPRSFDATQNNRLPSTYMIEDGSFFRIRNVQLGYNFNPTDFYGFNIQQMRLYINVQNLVTWANNSGFTPEAGGSPIEFGIDRGGYPIPVISTLGFSVTF